MIRNEVPLPGSEVTSMRPPCCSTRLFEIARPSPVPVNLVVKNGSKTLASCSGGDPRAVVLDRDDDRRFGGKAARPHGDPAALLRCRSDGLGGVLDQVDQDLADLRRIELERGQAGGRLGDELDALAAQRRAQELRGLVEELAEIGAGEAQRRRAPRFEQAMEDDVDAPELGEHLLVDAHRLARRRSRRAALRARPGCRRAGS